LTTRVGETSKMSSSLWSRIAVLLLALSTFRLGKAEQYYNDGEGDDAAVVEEYVNEYNSKYDSNADYVDGNGEIVYWTELAILPKRCIS
jgi:antirestriction protein